MSLLQFYIIARAFLSKIEVFSTIFSWYSTTYIPNTSRATVMKDHIGGIMVVLNVPSNGTL